MEHACGLSGHTNTFGAGRGGVSLAADSAVGALLATGNVAGHRFLCDRCNIAPRVTSKTHVLRYRWGLLLGIDTIIGKLVDTN